MRPSVLLCTLSAALAFGKAILRRQTTDTSVVNFANNTGSPSLLASGTLYGIPNNTNQIPYQFFSEIGWNYERAGGAQIPAPGRGWIWGVTEYQNRFQTVLDNYHTARSHNANFIFLIHDLYGADGTQNASTPYPGDNGSWTYWDDYLDHVVADMRQNGMLEAMIIDIWNEPDLGTVFWGRSQEQYLQMWGRTYYRFRREFGNQVLLSGPASAGEPLPDNTWWTNYAAFIAQNKSIPDQYAWHMEGGGGDLISAYGGLITILQTYHLPFRPVNINEYGTYPEQVPCGSAWWISELERINAHGLRGNWLSGYQLHDFMASLLSKPGAPDVYNPSGGGYFPNGDWQVYRFYAQSMGAGYRVGTLPSGDLKLDTFAVVEPQTRTATVLAGVRITTGTWNVQLTNLDALGIRTNGRANSTTLPIRTLAFRVNATDEHWGAVLNGPVDLGTAKYSVSAADGGSVIIPVDQTDATTAWAYEFNY